jgi:glutathione S-transferase
MIFYDCPTAPSPRLVRVFLAEKGLSIPVREVDLRGGEHLGPHFRAINPHCTVPVLELDDGTRFTTTQGCWRYLEETVPEPPLLGRTPVEKAAVAELVWRLEADGWQAMGEALRNAAPGLKGRALTGPDAYDQIPDLAERGRQRLRRFLDRFEGLLTGRPYLAGDAFTAADIFALVLIDFAGWIKMALPENAAHACQWLARVKGRPSAGG